MNKQVNDCFWCQQPLKRELQWQQIFRLKALEFDCLCQNCRKEFMIYQQPKLACQTCGRAVELCLEKWQKVLSHEANFKYGFEVEVEEGLRVEVESSRKKVILCFDCVRWLQQFPFELLKHDTVLEYNDIFREWLYRYKYQGDYRLKEVLVEPLKAAYHKYRDYEWLILPSSPNSLRERGFHATAGLLENASIPFVTPFTYIGDGRKQTQKTRLDRIQLSQPFAISDETFKILPRKILIFDDVYTTGATLLSAKKILAEKDHVNGLTTDKLVIVSLSLSRDSQFKRDEN